MLNVILQTAQGLAGQSDISIIVVTAISTIGAGGLVKLGQMWLDYRKVKKTEEYAPVNEYKDSLKQRVLELEDSLEALRARIEELITMYTDQILELSTERATLIAKFEAISLENEHLREELNRLTNK